jgi:hypothetical protein
MEHSNTWEILLQANGDEKVTWISYSFVPRPGLRCLFSLHFIVMFSQISRSSTSREKIYFWVSTTKSRACMSYHCFQTISQHWVTATLHVSQIQLSMLIPIQIYVSVFLINWKIKKHKVHTNSQCQSKEGKSKETNSFNYFNFLIFYFTSMSAL